MVWRSCCMRDGLMGFQDKSLTEYMVHTEQKARENRRVDDHNLDRWMRTLVLARAEHRTPRHLIYCTWHKLYVGPPVSYYFKLART